MAIDRLLWPTELWWEYSNMLPTLGVVVVVIIIVIVVIGHRHCLLS
jgi:hypothetical protein